jgi:molecular chaperone HscB
MQDPPTHTVVSVAVFEAGSDSLLPPPDRLDPFALFGLPPRAVLEEATLRAPYLALSRRIHPDRFTAAGPEQIVRAEAWAAALNKAYQTLKSPRLRLLWLLDHAKMAPAENGGDAPRELLAEVFELREALEELGASAPSQPVRSELSARRSEIASHISACADELGQSAAQWDAARTASAGEPALRAIADQVAKTLGRERFWTRLLNELDSVLARRAS